MSYYDSAGINDTLTPSMIGPNTDGTYTQPDASIQIQPVDAGGGMPAEYPQPILDIFKFGIAQYTATQQQAQLLDYKRFEATNGGLYRQGQPAGVAAAATGGTSNLMVFAAIGLVAVILLTHKG